MGTDLMVFISTYQIHLMSNIQTGDISAITTKKQVIQAHYRI